MALEVEAQLLRRKRAAHSAEVDFEAAVRSKEYWLSKQQEEWTELLLAHPLAGSAARVREHASVLVIDADAARVQASPPANPYGDVIAFARALGSGWDAIATPDALCGIRAGHDSVVLLRNGLIATDGGDEDCLRAVLAVAPSLKLKEPLVAVKDGLRAAAKRLLAVMGLPWRLTSIDVPAAKKSRAPRV